MGNIKIHRTTGFTTIKNTVFKDYSLSMKAKGLLAQLLSLPEDWDYSVAGLTKLFVDGKSSIETAIRELEAHNYVKRVRTQDLHGHFAGYDYYIYESPFTDFPSTVNPSTEKQLQLNIYDNNKELNNKIPPSANASPQGDVKKSKSELDLSFISQEFLPIMQEWIAYKKQKKQGYKQIGIEQCYANLLSYSGHDLETAITIVHKAIGNNSQGFHDYFNKKYDNTRTQRQTAQRPIHPDRCAVLPALNGV